MERLSVKRVEGAVYKELIYRACNTKETQILLGQNSKVVSLSRGQVLYGRKKFAKYLCWDDKTTDRTLMRLEKKYKKVTMSRTSEFTIVTLLNYEEIVGMTKWKPNTDQVATTSKSVKKANSEKSLYTKGGKIYGYKSDITPREGKYLSL